MTQHTITYDDNTHQLVPKEPEVEMLQRAMHHALLIKVDSDYGWQEYMGDLWRIMTAAAPKLDDAPSVQIGPKDHQDHEKFRMQPQSVKLAEVDQGTWIDAADKYVEKYEGTIDEEERAVIWNAYSSGGEWMRRLLSQPVVRYDPQAESSDFKEWWAENQACPEHDLITENAAHAAWQERAERANKSATGAKPRQIGKIVLDDHQHPYAVLETGYDDQGNQWAEGTAIYAIPVAAQPVVTEEMVGRFLGWKLPKDFYPDCGISFKESEVNGWPSGTNLFHAGQVKEMLRYVLEASTSSETQPAINQSDKIAASMSVGDQVPSDAEMNVALEHFDTSTEGGVKAFALWAVEVARDSEQSAVSTHSLISGSEADMFWDARCPEEGGEDFETELADATDNYQDADFPVTLTFQCAKRLPNIQVTVTGRSEDGDIVFREDTDVACEKEPKS